LAVEAEAATEEQQPSSWCWWSGSWSWCWQRCATHSTATRGRH